MQVCDREMRAKEKLKGLSTVRRGGSGGRRVERNSLMWSTLPCHLRPSMLKSQTALPLRATSGSVVTYRSLSLSMAHVATKGHKTTLV